MSQNCENPGEDPEFESGAQSPDPSKTNTESQTEEFLALLPDGVAEELDLKRTANQPIFPDVLDVSLAAYDQTNPAVWASDWRLLAPPDSAAYKDAVNNPKDIVADDSYKQILDTVVKSLPNSD